ncbi:MAG: glycoside hydrolase, partial [Acidobacteriota bacterium]|nr:glycoside hydrolase [Acidobacteriota bacterium]
MTTALVIHGHFYQPPRENPWTGLIGHEPGAQPFDNWNERVHAECYGPNGSARVFDGDGRVERVVNNYANLSFNFGPTLLAWLERRHPESYARVLDGDREGALARGGHGNAIAQGYHHSILPLCNERDRRTQVRWGVADFRRRFRREPESLWLPETACDRATLDTLAEEGLRYVILSPYQAARARPLGGGEWADVAGGRVATTVPYRYFHSDGAGRSIAVFFYDGLIARAVAFEGLLASSRALVERCVRAAQAGAEIVSVATDGESYGHHFRWGDLCLAYALDTEAAARGLRVTNYGEFLDGHEPRFEVEIDEGPGGEGSAWSCPHGVGRWSRDCGCNAGAPEGWDQRWRGPLRAA